MIKFAFQLALIVAFALVMFTVHYTPEGKCMIQGWAGVQCGDGTCRRNVSHCPAPTPPISVRK